MKKQEYEALAHQVQLHNQIKKWLRNLFYATTILAAVFYGLKSIHPILAWGLGILLTLFVFLTLAVGYAVWKSHKILQAKLA